MNCGARTHAEFYKQTSIRTKINNMIASFGAAMSTPMPTWLWQQQQRLPFNADCKSTFCRHKKGTHREIQSIKLFVLVAFAYGIPLAISSNVCAFVCCVALFSFFHNLFSVRSRKLKPSTDILYKLILFCFCFSFHANIQIPPRPTMMTKNCRLERIIARLDIVRWAVELVNRHRYRPAHRPTMMMMKRSQSNIYQRT